MLRRARHCVDFAREPPLLAYSAERYNAAGSQQKEAFGLASTHNSTRMTGPRAAASMALTDNTAEKFTRRETGHPPSN